MVTRTQACRSVASLALAGFISASIAVDAIAQSAPRTPPPGERPVQRTLPRNEIYANLSERLEISEADAQTLTRSVEDKGFPLRETVVLLLLANGRTNQLVEQGKLAKDRRVEGMRTSA